LKYFKNKKEKLNPFIFSLLIHGIILLLFFIIKIEFMPREKTVYSTLNFVETSPPKQQTTLKKEPVQVSKIPAKPKIKQEKKIQQKKEVTKNIVEDTILNKEKNTFPISKIPESTDQRLKFAATLLDSFLVRHPEYALFVLQEQAKDLVKKKNIKEFSRLELEKKINDELDEYLKKFYPEGSEHAMKKYTGPGLQIPLDGFIESIKKIFE
jgi:hypothetical protein